MLDVQCYIVGELATNCYVVTDRDTKKSAIIDPGAFSPALKRDLYEIESLNLKYILLTHGHYDHISAAAKIKKDLKAQIAIAKKEEELLKSNFLNLSSTFIEGGMEVLNADIYLRNNETLLLGDHEIKFISTPGHTVGSGCFIFDRNIFTGDTLMKDTIGRTDLPTGNFSQMNKSLKKLYNLEGEYKVYPGHGEFTTLDYERRHNEYMGKKL